MSAMDDDDRLLQEWIAERSAILAAQDRPVTNSPIDGATYRDFSLWRWSTSTVDDKVAAFAYAFAGADGPGREALTDRLTLDDLWTVLHFSQRRCLQAIRTTSAATLAEAADALSTLDEERLDHRDLTSAARLVAATARYLGLDGSELAAAVTRARPAVGRTISAAVEFVFRLVDDQLFDNATGYSVVGPPGAQVLFRHRDVPFVPAPDLVPVALDLAAAIDAEGSYLVTEVGLATGLPARLVTPVAARASLTATVRMGGGVHLRAHARPGVVVNPDRHDLWIWLVRTASVGDAQQLAAAGDGQRGHTSVLVLAHEELVAVLAAQCTWHGVASIEDPQRLQRFRPLLAHAVLAAG
jgi:hypothetical protein